MWWGGDGGGGDGGGGDGGGGGGGGGGDGGGGGYKIIYSKHTSFNSRYDSGTQFRNTSNYHSLGHRNGRTDWTSVLRACFGLYVILRIRTAIETITADKLQTVWNELDYRVDVCRITKGSHIERL